MKYGHYNHYSLETFRDILENDDENKLIYNIDFLEKNLQLIY